MVLSRAWMLLGLPLALRAQAPSWEGLSPGAHAAGFRIVDTVDVTRSFPTAAGTMGPRPMRLYVWYPAVQSASVRRVIWSELAAEAWAFLPAPADPVGQARRALISRASDQAAIARADSLLARRLNAGWNAPHARGQFPVILIPPGTPTECSISAEFLASHGFVVIGMGRRDRWTVQPAGRRTTLAGIDVEASDLEFALGAARGWRFADASRVGVMGFSASTLSTLSFAFRSRAVDAVVSLEGWEGTVAGEALIRTDPHYDPVAFRAAYLLMGKASDEAAPFQKTSAFLDSMRHAPRWRIAFDSTGHGDFLFFPALPRPRTFARSNEYALSFFQAQLGTDQPRAWNLPNARDGVVVTSYPGASDGRGRQ